MEYISYEWYDIITEQSNNPKLGIMALRDLEFWGSIDDPNGFLVVNIKKIPKVLKPFLIEDTVLPTEPFRFKNKVLLHNEKLSKYLALAKSFRLHFPQRFCYVEVLFERKEEKFNYVKQYPLDLNKLDNLLSPVAIFSCWEILTANMDLSLLKDILEEAERGFFINREYESFAIEDLNLTKFKMLLDAKLGYTFLTVVNAWVRNFDKAKELILLIGGFGDGNGDAKFIFRYYLEICFVYDRYEDLGCLFDDDRYRDNFFTHYELFIQKYRNSSYTITRFQQAKVVLQRIEEFQEKYYISD